MFNRINARWHNLLEDHDGLEKTVKAAQSWVPPVNYITIHYTYFVLGTLVASVIFWGSSHQRGDISYVDSLFLVTSAFTNTGLNTINVSTATTWQQVLLWLLMLVGSPLWISLWTVMVRKRAFEHRFEEIVAADRAMRKRNAGASIHRAPALDKVLNSSSSQTAAKAVRNKKKSGLALLGYGETEQQSSGPISTVFAGADNHPKLQRASTAPSEKTPEEGQHTSGGSSTIDAQADSLAAAPEHISFAPPLARSGAIEGARTEPGPLKRRDSGSSSASSGSDLVDELVDDLRYHWRKIVGDHNVSRNGQFYDLSSDERDRIGGCEYRALKILSVTVPLYFVLFQLFGSLALGAWIARDAPEVAAKFSVGSWWSGIFLAVSTFNNCGMSLIDESMVPFARSWFPLIVTGLLTMAGNTAYPILLRFILWCLLKILQYTTPLATLAPWKETADFILKYPRRVYTTLFNARLTWWLLAVLVIINVVDWVGFEVLSIGNADIEKLSIGQRVMDGLYHAVCLRTSGLLVIPLSSLYIDLQFLYLITMYIAVYPVVITMRTSNVYEERSLGIYDEDPKSSALSDAQTPGLPLPSQSQQEPSDRQFLRRRKTAAVVGKTVRSAMTFNGVGAARQSQATNANGGGNPSRVSFLGQQIRGQLAHDTWWLVVVVFIIIIIENDQFVRDPLTFSPFNIIFECVSGYGGIGMSTGLPDQNYSFSGAWHTASKVLLCAIMMRGRHRGLPVALDRAVRLPGEKMHVEEEEDHKIRRTMTISRISRELSGSE